MPSARTARIAELSLIGIAALLLGAVAATVFAPQIARPVAPTPATSFSLDDPAARAELDAYLSEWTAAHAGEIYDSVNNHMREQAEANQPKAADFALGDALWGPEFAAVGASYDAAEAVLVEFFDYNCGYCRAMHPIIQELRGQFPGLRIVYRDLPILHETSLAAAKAARAAELQGVEFYDAFHNRLFETGTAEAQLVAIATEIGLDLDRWNADRASDEIAEKVAIDKALATSLKISGTPMLVVASPDGSNLQIFPGATPPETLTPAIEAAIQ